MGGLQKDAIYIWLRQVNFIDRCGFQYMALTVEAVRIVFIRSIDLLRVEID